ncbi:alpha/beta hydrolase family protein [Tupanvirus deep ocean]|uniref:Alpha/beta hydrolase family protein n=2 Tax=Tupanvirus TaxID=2094720 RepID=A0AC62A8L8_9VIRU|nr:alpha/beta hydrolase family protein [Tupanvirus deep ocean]QKU34005.1 alpha/beta hydrolase family protein [Tupanvirus deep ocean]
MFSAVHLYFLNIIYFFTIVIIAFKGFVSRIVDIFVFYPHCKNQLLYNDINSDTSKLIFTKTKNNKRVSLAVFFPKNISNPTKCLVYCHGNRATIVNKMNYFKKLSNELGLYVITFDYLGYGISENERPSEQGCYDSMEAVMEYVQYNLKIDKSNIYLVGRSLGTGIVVDYVAKNDWNNPIMLISPYKNIITVVMDFWFFSWFNKFNTLKKIQNVKCPVKIIHGNKDNVIDISHSKIIAKKIPNKSFPPVWLDNVGHNKIFKMIDIGQYFELINYKN